MERVFCVRQKIGKVFHVLGVDGSILALCGAVLVGSWVDSAHHPIPEYPAQPPLLQTVNRLKQGVPVNQQSFAPSQSNGLKTSVLSNHRQGKKKVLPLKPIAINRATAQQLQTLPGVGPKMAQRIIIEREQHGPFQNLDDLKRVRGIGPKRANTLKPFLQFSSS